MVGGGAERQLLMLVAAQIARGHEVHVVLGAGGEHYERLRNGRAHVHMVSGRGSHDPRMLLRIIQLVRKLRPSIIQTWLTQMDVFGGIAAIVTGTPWVLAERSAPEQYGRLKDRVLRRLVARGADAFVGNSRTGLAYWASHARRGAIMTLVKNALPLREIAAAAHTIPADFAAAGNAPLIVYAGRLSAEKNIFLLLDALAVVCARSTAVAVLCGDGPLRAAIEERIAILGLAERVRVVGFRTDLWAILKAATVCVNPSRFEGRPNAVLEAIACRCPVVVSDIPAHREFLDASTAVFVPVTSSEGMAQGILSVLAGGASAALRVEHAAALLSEYEPQVVAAAHDRVYHELLDTQG